MRKYAIIAVLALTASFTLQAQQVTSDRIARAAEEPQNWLTYSGGYFSQRYSTLNQGYPAQLGLNFAKADVFPTINISSL